jgi:hypothetical protein
LRPPSALTTQLDAVQTAVSQLGQDTSAAALLAVGAAIKDLATAARASGPSSRTPAPELSSRPGRAALAWRPAARPESRAPAGKEKDG